MSKDYFIDVVGKALDVLSLFDFRHDALTLDDVADRLGITRSRAFRILQTLEAKHFVSQDQDRQHYRLGRAAARIGLLARTRDRVDELIRSSMYELRQEFMETVNFGVLDGNIVVYANILESPQAFRMSAKVGDQVPLTTTAIGRAILAVIDHPEHLCKPEELALIQPQLEHARHAGYALDDEEDEAGARCVGIALKAPTGEVLGALSVSGPASRLSTKTIQMIGARLIQISNQIQYPHQETLHESITTP